MAKTENRRVEDSFVTTCSSIISGTITFFLFMLVTVFPLIYHRGYADILENKILDLLCDCNWYGSDCGNIGADYAAG